MEGLTPIYTDRTDKNRFSKEHFLCALNRCHLCGSVLSFFFCGEDAVGDGGGFYGGADVVDAEDVGSGEDCGYVGGGGGVEAVFGGGCYAVEQCG